MLSLCVMSVCVIVTNGHGHLKGTDCGLDRGYAATGALGGGGP